ncbi:penicillin amidase [Faunimonas pinastri]|uniref:Penicillin amidase n=1 Tax=Faunimonas pinastri TaxID=1855383 RepID=A0A1H9E1H2_9HYPH|nr:penicillin acylase family protein [Faunimonas pinastri]SEQ19442.1 penicillin amidase [Faunimonas pinastri]
MRVEEIDVAGLSAPAEITVDRWGIPHLKADNLLDLFFLQGYNAARDRLWQIDLWRKRGLGLLAADFGPGYLAQDRASRLFLYRGDMDAEWAAYSDDARDICTSFAAGINAFIDSVTEDALPPEFRLMGTRPAKWQPEDVVRIRSHSMMRNALSEVIRANVISAAGPEIDLLRQHLDPARDPHRPDGVNLAEIPLAVLDVFKLALAAVTFEDERLAAPLHEAGRWTRVAATGDVVRDANAQGSNNWVVHGSRTDTGRPIMANDPHRLHAVPSLRYLVHLTAPGFDAIGAGEPCLPGICIGHNGTAAFGLTLFFGPDQEDVYVYETSPEDPHLYRYGEGWEAMRVETETAPVKGAADQAHTLKFTRHGPVAFEDRERHRAYAIRSVWAEPGTAPYFASIVTMRARSLDEFRAGMTKWGVPATNQVYADTSGTIGWLAAGFSPVRPNWDGLLPVFGDGRYEWDGFYRAGDLPEVANPEAGFFATANEPNLPADWPHEEKQIGYEWLERSRMNRITEVFAQGGTHTVASSCALQTDVLSIPARRLAVLVRKLPGSAVVDRVRRIFEGWDFRITPDSAAATLFEVWWSKHLRTGLMALVAPERVRALLLPGDPESVLKLLESPDARLGKAPEEARDALLTTSLAAAWEECVQLMGSDPARWRWGDLHQGYFAHALSATSRPAGDEGFDVGPFEKGGTDSTPMNALYRTSDFRVTLGASVRVVVDVGGWDNSRCINAPGQSGDPASPHYGNLAAAWAEGSYVPLLYSPEAIDEAAETQFVLRPAR